MRIRVRVEGVVQGVGFRPFVHAVAHGLGLAGFVGNDGAGVVIEAEGDAAALDRLVEALRTGAPPLARVEHVGVEEIEPSVGAAERAGAPPVFTISASDATGPRTVLVAPDTATCADCLAEMADPGDRRFGYAFTNCTNCGPRHTIVRELPYDRAGTTMAAFPLCGPCEKEYKDPANRRFHAQPVCCPDCGPRLRVCDAQGADLPGDPVAVAAALLAAGRIVAIKGLGGYHLAVAARDEEAVRTLRSRKHREERPLALMVRDVAAARTLCEVDDAEAALLQDISRPIVLLARRPDAEVAASAAPGQRALGLMLPYTPLHHLLTAAFPEPLVMTSGNVSSEPIAHRDDDALERLAGIADAFLLHDRAIHTRVDDSVARVVRGTPALVRRSRGHAPAPVSLPWEFPRHVLACGPELKNTFCLARDRHAFVSHHIGDLENHETLTAFTEGVEHFRRLFSVSPEVVVHDLHPEYLSTKYALDYPEDVAVLGVQHHHAHIASCLADNGVDDAVIGVAFDGLGMGTDGTLWGGEFLVADLAGFTRAAHLAAVPMPGGARAVKEPWRMGLAYLDAAYGTDWPDTAAVAGLVRRQESRAHQVAAAARAGLNSPATSSAGRLFDAVAALAGVRDAVAYEGQAAIELEQLADRDERGAYQASIAAGPAAAGPDGAPMVVSGADLVRAVLDDLAAGTPVPVVSARFHQGLAATVVEVCRRVRETSGLATVALSGGVFQNVLLLERCLDGLAAAGFAVLTHRRVPANDGGISLGQAAVSGALDRRRLDD